MNKYTIIGNSWHNGEAFVEHVIAPDKDEAVVKAQAAVRAELLEQHADEDEDDPGTWEGDEPFEDRENPLELTIVLAGHHYSAEV